MRKKIHLFIKDNGLYILLSLALPMLIMAVVYAKIGIYPGSEHRTILASDAFSQYVNFYASLNNVFKGDQSIFYTWNSSMGLNYWTFIAYYLGGIFSPLVLFFSSLQLPDFLYYLTLLKIGSLGGAFWIFSYQTFRLPKWNHVVLSVSYALMSFVIAYSEILMWLDAMLYLPLIVLGIHRLMDKKKPVLLFVSYFLLFVSNFYMAFMVGLFTFGYFLARLLTNRSQYLPRFPMYLITSLLAGGASMVMILPTLLDLRNNGEALSKIVRLKTKNTGPWDLVIKNMVGIYDSTKVKSTPFIYIGLLAVVFCLFFFVTKKVALRQKICYGSLLLVLVASFYLEPLNLFWQGMHTPNMFNFRFSFLFSFFVLVLAGYGFEKFKPDDFDQLVTIVLGLIGTYMAVKFMTGQGDYTYIQSINFIWTLVFLISYLFLFALVKRKNGFRKGIGVFFILLVCVEAGLNSYGIVEGIQTEWHYPARKYYADPYQPIKELVDQTKDDNDTFYRLENLNPVSPNDAFNYGYSGVSMFSSIRNRHSSYYLNGLGYRSLGTNLNIRYANNTLLMDSLVGIKYNLAKEDVLKFGYSKISEKEEYALYENKYALPLGMWTDDAIYEPGAVESQATLLNHLAKTNEDFFTFSDLEQVNMVNIREEKGRINQTDVVTYIPKKQNEPMVLEWTVEVPANKQAYVSIFPVDYRTFGSPTLKLEVDGVVYDSSVSETGQYYSLGYHKEAKKVTFKMTISNVKKQNVFQIVQPDVALLDVDKFSQSIEAIKDNGVEFKVEGRRAKAEVSLDQDQVLFTSIPYDKGWKAYIDGKKVPIPTFKQALLTLPVSAGEHEIEFVFLPQGFLTGVALLLICMGSFIVYVWIVRKKETDPFYMD
ncbi:YfhO family protein [Enterococcus plantarum]|uniref:YfhO family protein n=1 Tax=Enterococcus plantarum TaxID=1077675 RepID=UPI001A8CF864|nr:YfhO family protein [Enterococcus plantarum]MBO0423647.1 YfhO family protein [Enterococcus plantarum]